MTPADYRTLRTHAGLTAAQAAQVANRELVDGAGMLRRYLGWRIRPPGLVIEPGPRCQWISRLETGRIANPDPWLTAALVAAYERAIMARKDDRA